MGAQRSAFSVNAGINRSGDVPDTVIPSDWRELPKGAQLLGAQVVVTADAFGGATFVMRVQATNEEDPGASGQTFLLEGQSSPITGATSFMLGGADQLIPVTHARFIRTQIVVTGGSASDFDNLNVATSFKTDYLTG